MFQGPKRLPPSSGVKTNATGTGASITVLAANPNRKGGILFNDSGVAADIDMTGGTASATSCSFNMLDQDYYEIPYGYTGPITGNWASGDIRVTEFV